MNVAHTDRNDIVKTIMSEMSTIMFELGYHNKKHKSNHHSIPPTLANNCRVLLYATGDNQQYYFLTEKQRDNTLRLPKILEMGDEYHPVSVQFPIENHKVTELQLFASRFLNPAVIFYNAGQLRVDWRSWNKEYLLDKPWVWKKLNRGGEFCGLNDNDVNLIRDVKDLTFAASRDALLERGIYSGEKTPYMLVWEWTQRRWNLRVGHPLPRNGQRG
jgi:hypothetical protein